MLILAINPGSTSTKFSVYNGENEILEEVLRHSSEEISKYSNIIEQLEFRKKVILDSLKENKINLNNLSAIVGRGGLLRPLTGGTYEVNDNMLTDLKSGKYGEHASNLGAIIAYEIAKEYNIPSYIVDPVVVDEMTDIARLSGHPKLVRKSIFHALNQKAVARKVAKEMGKKYEELNMIVVHLGGGISVGLHQNGRVVDVNNALDGDGPFTPERAGSLPAGGLAKLCFSGEYNLGQVKKLLKGKGGLVAYLDSNDGREVCKRINEGDEKALLVYKAMAYQIAKEIGGLAAGCKGETDAIVITGGLAYDKEYLMPWVTKAVEFIAPVKIVPGEMEMEALALGALRVLNKEEDVNVY
ncbi:butyrate kinase [Clostridium sp. 'deep sea']|uniref:butyrate kinase n=1 Tax=Clostridium sp. 'deep sea' TaxID=2779445 RepID=UPI0018967AA7|nr:butyrate kinase [Clostridium sp. 'deep sea']QOR35837.1 butyrate kinase [Clostridium sp. 'deep sea']